ncbi:MAG: alpha-E domain-containing protein [Planctomycetota bacterium]|nr:alpha-E domain-containing protein [Planctomycetota bacterium]
MLSRVASSMYWLSRYVERAENVARFIEVNQNLILDLPDAQQQWEPLVVTTGDDEEFTSRYKNFSKQNVLEFLSFDLKNGSSIRSCVRAARENARSVRGNLSTEIWEGLNTFYLEISNAAADPKTRDDPQEFYQNVKRHSHLLLGIMDATMSRGEGWHFSHLGRMLERADKTSRILDVKYYLLLPSPDHVGSPIDETQWSAVLRSTSALEMYRKKHHTILPPLVVDFLLLDREFPRAAHYCLQAADESLHAITGTPQGTFRNVAEQRLGQLRSEIAFTHVSEVIRAGLHEFIDGLQIRLNLIGDGIHESFFMLRPHAAELTPQAQGMYQQQQQQQ